jgi:hypothetical protein
MLLVRVELTAVGGSKLLPGILASGAVSQVLPSRDNLRLSVGAWTSKTLDLSGCIIMSRGEFGLGGELGSGMLPLKIIAVSGARDSAGSGVSTS